MSFPPLLRRLAAALALLGIAACGDAGTAPSPAGADATAAAPLTIRVGHFPNVTHAQALIAHDATRNATPASRGWFEDRLGPGVKIEWFTYNAGPSAMEALLAGAIDLTYVGPNPALNAHIKSKGADIRVISGAARGGAALVVRAGSGVRGPADLRGKKLATPQLGNTQDVAARAWLTAAGLTVTQTGGDVAILPTANPDQLALFAKGDLDAVWTVEPWVSRLEREAGGELLVEEKDAVTTVLATSDRFLTAHPATVKAFAKAHEELSAWIGANPAAAQEAVRREILAETKNAMPAELLAHAWPRLRFTPEITTGDFTSFLAAAQSAGFLKDAGDISGLVRKP